MTTDISGLPPEIQKQIHDASQAMNAVINAAILHMTTAHGTPPIVLVDANSDAAIIGGLCEDGVMLLCGKNVYAKIRQLQEYAQTIYSSAVALQTIEKARS